MTLEFVFDTRNWLTNEMFNVNKNFWIPRPFFVFWNFTITSDRLSSLQWTVSIRRAHLLFYFISENAFSIMRANSGRHYGTLRGAPVAMETADDVTVTMTPCSTSLKRQSTLEQFGFYQISHDSKVDLQFAIKPRPV